MAEAASGRPAPKRREGFKRSVGRRICLRLADGESLRGICGQSDMPVTRTVYKWLARGLEDPQGPYGEFRRSYLIAREIGAEALLERLQEIADAAGEGEAFQLAKLRIDTLKWRLDRMGAKAARGKAPATPDETLLTHEEALAELE